MTKKMKLLLLLTLLSIITVTKAYFLVYEICQTGCNTLAVSCYAAADFTFGTITGGLGAPAVIVACNVSLGVCMASCVAAGLSPTP